MKQREKHCDTIEHIVRRDCDAAVSQDFNDDVVSSGKEHTDTEHPIEQHECKCCAKYPFVHFGNPEVRSHDLGE